MVIQTTRRWKSKNKFGIRNSSNNDKKEDNDDDDDDDDDDGDGNILEIYIFHCYSFIVFSSYLHTSEAINRTNTVLPMSI